MLSSEVSDCLQVSLDRHHEAVHRSDITFIEFVILFQNEVFVLEDDVLLFLFTCENRVDPIAVVHVHRIEEARLYDVSIDFSCLANNFLFLLRILGYQLLTGRIDHLA